MAKRGLQAYLRAIVSSLQENQYHNKPSQIIFLVSQSILNLCLHYASKPIKCAVALCFFKNTYLNLKNTLLAHLGGSVG